MKAIIRATMTIAASLIMIAATVVSAQAQWRFPTRYSYYSLNALDPGSSSWSYARAINNNGEATGDAHYGFKTLPNQAGASNVGVLTGDYRSYAYAINNYGTVVGESVNTSGVQRAIQFNNSTTGPESLHTLAGTVRSSARGINDHSWMVGYVVTTANSTQAMLSFGPGWTYNIEASLGMPYESAAYDVNNLDQLVGYRRLTSMGGLYYLQPRAFFYNLGGGTIANRLVDIGTLSGGIWSIANSINDQGQVVGQSDKWVGTQRWTHAFIWKDANGNGLTDAGEMRDLDTLNSATSNAKSINNAGVAVGSYGNTDIVYGNSRAVMYSTSGQMIDLNTQIAPGSGWILREATGINDNGQIVGWMEDSNPDVQARVRRGFRMDPPPPVILYPIFP